MNTESFTTFELEGQLFGIDIRFVREINKQLELSPVPHSPAYIRGLINLRGQIVTVMDLKKRLGFSHSEVTNETHNLIIKTDQERVNVNWNGSESSSFSLTDKVGLLVDKIGEVVTLPSSELENPPANIGKMDGKYLSGVIKLEDQLIAVLNLKQILSEA
jgi:purine-binding chemotaxis protein CheW